MMDMELAKREIVGLWHQNEILGKQLERIVYERNDLRSQVADLRIRNRLLVEQLARMQEELEMSDGRAG